MLRGFHMEENQACSFRPANFVLRSHAKKSSLQSGLKQSHVTLFTLLNAQNNEKNMAAPKEKVSSLVAFITLFHKCFMAAQTENLLITWNIH